MIRRMLAIWSLAPLPFLASLIARLIKNLPAVQETPVQFLGREGYPLQYSWASLWLSWQRIQQQGGRLGFNPWVGKIPWTRERLPTPVFWPGEFCGLYTPWGCKELDTTEWLSLSLSFLNPAWTSRNSRFMCCWSLVWRILSVTLLGCEMSAIVR